MSLFQKDFTVTWIIKNFSFLNMENENFLLVKKFIARNICKSDWEICFSSDDSGQYVFLDLYRSLKTAEDKALRLDVEVELCNSGNETLCVTEKRGIDFPHKKRYIFKNLMLLSELNKKMQDDPGDTLFLRCRMRSTGERETDEETLSRSCAIRTTVLFDESSYTRNVYYSESSDWSRTLTFPVNESGNLNVTIKASQDEILFHIRPQKVKWPGNIIKGYFRKVKCEISLLDYDETVIVSNGGILIFFENTIWHFPPFLKKSLLKKETSRLRLKFYFAIFNSFSNAIEYAHDSKHLTLPSSHKDSKNVPVNNSLTHDTKHLTLPSSNKEPKNAPASSSLTDDLRKMLFSKDHADVSFHVDTEVIRAHKNILSFRSPVFATMFQQPMTESETGVIHITDMNVQTLKLFLEFVYTGELPELDWERMLELLLAAEKYQVPSLKERCSRFLKRHFSTDNVCDVVSVADLVGEDTLKAAAMDYIKENVAEVLGSSKWSTLTERNVKLCSEIFCKFSEDLKAKLVKI